MDISRQINIRQTRAGSQLTGAVNQANVLDKMKSNHQNSRRTNRSLNGKDFIAYKAGESIRSQETQVMKDWLKALIDELDLGSLEAFPTRELSQGIPRMICSLAHHIEEPLGSAISLSELDEVAGCIANLRKQEPSLAKLVEDYALLKKLLLRAVSTGLRESDRAIIDIMGNLDEGFYHIFKAGLAAYVEQHSMELQQLADTDPLTGLFNVRYFRQQLHRQLELYKRYRIPFSLLMLDLDELKQLNDEHGHEAGDLALRSLALILKEEKRETDIAVRYGGDEFFLLLPATSMTEGERLANRISCRVGDLDPGNRRCQMTGVSIGIVTCPDDGTDVGTLRSKADQAMYLAKTLGSTVARYREL